MALTIIYGGTNSNRSTLLVEELVVAVAGQQPALLVPASTDVRRAQRGLAEAGVLGVRVATLDAWIEEMWTLFGDGTRFVGSASRAALMSDLAQDSDAGVLGISVNTPGFVDLVSDLAKRLAGPVTARGAGTVAGISNLLHKYELRLAAAGLIESSRATRLLSEVDIRLPGPVGIDGFTDFNDEQLALIESIAASGDITVGLLWSGERTATQALTPIVDRLVAAGARLRRADCVQPEDAGLAMLEAALFEESEPIRPGDTLVLGEAAGTEAECALVAQAAGEAIKRSGPSDVAVVFRRFDARVPVLLAALRTENVPFALDVSLPFASIPYGRALEALTDAVALRGNTRERALAFLTSPYSGVDHATVAMMDEQWRKQRAQSEEILSSMERDARGLVRLARRLANSSVNEKTAKDWKELADILLANSEACREERLADVVRDAAGHRALLNAVSEVVDVQGASEADLRRALRSVRVAVVEGDAGAGVLVTEAHRLRGLRFDTVILGGLTAGEFSPGNRDSLLVTLCDQLGISRPADSSLAERMLFHGVISAATRGLVLLRQATDERGEAIRPSVFWDEVLDLYRSHQDALDDKWPEGLRRVSLSLSDMVSAAPAFTPGRAALRRTVPLDAPVPVPRGRVASPRAVAELASREEFSVSEIEKYIACPYQWFYDRILRPKDIDSALDARERGTLAHTMLANFYREWEKTGRSRVLPAQLDDALALLDTTIDEIVADSRIEPVTLADHMSLAKAGEWAKGIVRDDVGYLPGFKPAYHELGFGARHDRPVRIGGVALTGAVDRVDVSPDGFFITDYKSASAPDGRASFTSRGRLQIPLYSAVVAQLTGLPVLGGVYRSLKSLAARGFWDEDRIDLGMRGTKTDRCSKEEIQEEMDAAAECLVAAVGQMREGIIGPNPRGKDACEYCGARHVCGEAL